MPNNRSLKYFKQKQSVPLSRQAYNEIKEAIIQYALKPGDPLIEEQIAKNFNFSRTPVREALKMLQNEGLVKIIPNKGAFVTEITKSDIEEIFVLREVLECTALKLAVQRVNEDELSELETLLNKAEVDAKKNKRDSSIESDLKLHELIIKASGYKKISEILNVLNVQLLRSRYIGITVKGRIEKSIQEHKEILLAMKKRDGHLAEKLLKNHIRNVRDNLLIAL